MRNSPRGITVPCRANATINKICIRSVLADSVLLEGIRTLMSIKGHRRFGCRFWLALLLWFWRAPVPFGGQSSTGSRPTEQPSACMVWKCGVRILKNPEIVQVFGSFGRIRKGCPMPSVRGLFGQLSCLRDQDSVPISRRRLSSLYSTIYSPLKTKVPKNQRRITGVCLNLDRKGLRSMRGDWTTSSWIRRRACVGLTILLMVLAGTSTAMAQEPSPSPPSPSLPPPLPAAAPSDDDTSPAKLLERLKNMEKTIQELRDQNKELKDQYGRISKELEDSRKKDGEWSQGGSRSYLDPAPPGDRPGDRGAGADGRRRRRSVPGCHAADRR